MKKFWRCFVCNDIHYGIGPPDICPTCNAENAYVEISSNEAKKITGVTDTSVDRTKFLQEIERFSKENEFRVNPDPDKVGSLIQGIFENEKNHGMKFCPCRLTTKDAQEDLKLVCPCNFRIHETYKDKSDGECWCGLFVKRKSDSLKGGMKANESIPNEGR